MVRALNLIKCAPHLSVTPQARDVGLARDHHATHPWPRTIRPSEIHMLTAMPGQQYSKRELSAMLKGAGFRNIEIKPTFGYLERSHRRETVSRGGGGRTEGGPCVMLK